MDEESTQEVSGPLATEESEDGPIGRTMFRSRHLTPKHSHLMAEHDDLDRQIGVDTSRESEELKRAYEGDLEERESHGPFSRDPHPLEKVPSQRGGCVFGHPHVPTSDVGTFGPILNSYWSVILN